MLAWRRDAALLRSFPVAVVIAFSVAIFTSATLLFVVQPMIGKMVLPLLGGTPAVWNTCMAFFQGTLLAGYLYSHAVAALALPRQLILHAIVILLALLVLPIGVDSTSFRLTAENPVFQLFGVLLVAAGLPFFVVSTTAPLLQKWFTNTHHPAAQDPYFLYAASNIGSIAALLAYPTLLEPHLRLVEQSRLWTAGYAALIVLVIGCGLLALLSARSESADAGADRSSRRERSTPAMQAAPLTIAQRLRWIALAFVPSSLMLGVTTYVTSDVATIPLLWVTPLLLYLLTFVLAFSRWRPLVLDWALRIAPLAVLLLVFLTLSHAAPLGAFWSLVPLHFGAFFVLASVCHCELARTRPAAEHLTAFYVWMSLGGVLGGLFNSLVAPTLFHWVAEYPLAIVLACLLIPSSSARADTVKYRWLDIGLPLAVTALTASLLVQRAWLQAAVEHAAALAGLQPGALDHFARALLRTNFDVLLTLGMPLVLCYLFAARPLRFALGVAGVLVATIWLTDTGREVLHRERTFFGVLRVEQKGDVRWLVHGVTAHGLQNRHPAWRGEPLLYFHRAGPIGQVFDVLHARGTLPHIGIIGLGAGSMAAYGKPGEKITFYEIDPAVSRIASEYFSYLDNAAARGVDVRVVLGDARIRIAESTDQQFAILAIDAFSSDAIPVHLITYEAVQLYLSRLAPNGVLAFHISNRYLDLEPVLGRIAQAGRLTSLVRRDTGDNALGKSPSHWVVIARRPQDLGSLVHDAKWSPLSTQPDAGLWTDDSSNLLRVFRWRR
jgi:hypothetical protein